MLISIIMPAYNASAYVKQAIDSILNQTYTKWELLIADDGSSDDTKTIVDSYADSRIKSFHNEKNLGYLKTCNKLFSLCSGDLITFQDADDWSSPERLEKQVVVFANDSSLGICGTWACYYSLNNEVLRRKCTPVSHNEIIDHMHHHNPFCGASIMIRREMYNLVGGYQEFFDRIGNEDYDWSIRIVERVRAMNIPEFLYFVRVTSDSISRSIKSPRQLISHELVLYLANQRKNEGKDSLTGVDFAALQQFEQKLLHAYQKDKSLLYRKAADIAAYNRDWKKLKMYSWYAWKSQPFKLINCKYFVKSIYQHLS